MKVNTRFKSLVFAIAALLALPAIAPGVFAQQTRPRYSGQQRGGQSWVVPADTVISLRMDSSLSSRTARVGDKFTSTVTIPVYIDGVTVIPAGSTVEGRVTQVTPAKRMSKSGTIAIDFDDLIFPDGSRIQLDGNLTSDDPSVRDKIDDESRVSGNNEKRPAVFIGGGGAIGAVLGGISGGGKGAVIGGVLGAGAGVAGVLLSKGEEAQVPSGTPFAINLTQPIQVMESQLPDRRSRDYGNNDPVNDNSYPSRDSSPRDSASRDPYPSRDPNPPSRDSDYPAEPEPSSDPDADTGDAGPDSDAGAAGAAEPAEASLPLSSPEMLRRAQVELKNQGYYEGQADGAMSPRTANALKTYQQENNLPATGELDARTAEKLGITGASRPSAAAPARPSGPKAAASESVLANVLSATAARTAEGAIQVVINTQANTGGWRWFGEHVVNGDTLEVYARAIPPSGVATQALSRGRVEVIARDGVDYVRRVIVHGARGDINVPFGSRSDVDPGAPSAPGNRPTPVRAAGESGAGLSLQRQAEELLADYQRIVGVRLTGTGVELEGRGQYREPEIDLLFAIDSFANAAQLYSRLASSSLDQDGLRASTLALARQARATDRVMTTTSSRSADAVARRWDSIRQEVLRLMQRHNITSSDIEN
ncbi:MAG TPA: peptidoglycan-binding protein [Blastocatellia bacterium]|nr:peptidoglycan-binding protein [Blastocatellia bacterium]